MLQEINEILWWLDACTYAHTINHVRAHENAHMHTYKKRDGGGKKQINVTFPNTM
jgi:hypothetical protein